MKKRCVYPAFLILLGFAVLFSTSCSRRSGCYGIQKTTKPDKRSKPPGNRDLFGHRMR
ncbi:hypothetical protein GGR26_002665 [Lewinella marina]|uniref:hypothetical protein n=1 Tax=Neolewinella marina TaxID=438751 RepID=UPI0014313C80|nr:hypothetical protein [Neolewinella marina]NJB86888.1 hypothetical protein [Neolewinella marina]